MQDEGDAEDLSVQMTKSLFSCIGIVILGLIIVVIVAVVVIIAIP